MRFGFISLATTMAATAFFIAAPARAEVVHLYCSDSSAVWNFYIDVDYDAKTVTVAVKPEAGPRRDGKIYSAQITSTNIRWRGLMDLSNEPYDGNINRLTGEFYFTSKSGSSDRTCQRAEEMKPKF